jgi:hypothetical protein
MHNVYIYIYCIYIYISTYLSIYRSIYWSIYRSIYRSIYPSIYVWIYLSNQSNLVQSKSNLIYRFIGIWCICTKILQYWCQIDAHPFGPHILVRGSSQLPCWGHPVESLNTQTVELWILVFTKPRKDINLRNQPSKGNMNH